LQAIFAGVNHAERAIESVESQRTLAALKAELAALDLQADASEPLAGPPGAPVSRAGVQVQRNV
jgi:hypothetical protein